MIIGIAKEMKTEEYRVSLLPNHVSMLVQEGKTVLVEENAGKMAGFEDLEYLEAGAQIVPKEKLYENSDLILKVKCPLESEYNYFKKGQILFAYLHFDENISPTNINKIVSTGVTGIAYEWVNESGIFPLLIPMSELAGTLFALETMNLLMKNKGVLPGGYFSSLSSPCALIIGIGHIGANVLKVLLMNNFNIIIVDKTPNTIKQRALKYIDEDIWDKYKENISIIEFNNENPDVTKHVISNLLGQIDLIISSAIRRPNLPKNKMEYLIDREMISKMKKGSVVSDTTACDMDLIETIISSAKLLETYEVNGIIHYNCDHIPSLVSSSASILLANAIFPYVKLLSEKGFYESVKKSNSLYGAVMCYDKQITHEYTCQKKNLPYSSLNDLLK